MIVGVGRLVGTIVGVILSCTSGLKSSTMRFVGGISSPLVVSEGIVIPREYGC